MAGPRAWLRYLGVLGCASALAAACGGEEFAAAPDPVGSGAAAGDMEPATGGSSVEAGAPGSGGKAGTTGTGGSSAGSAGSGAGTTSSGGSGSTVLCLNGDDCNDNNPCSLDVCNADGVCEYPPKCGGVEPRCCDGECGQCCMDTDCPVINDCMIAQCVDGFCTNTPGSCQPGEYCGPNGCMPQEMCQGDGDCSDEDPCTDEICVDGLCQYPSCPDSAKPFCCANGCAACCGDSQCGGDAENPCEPSSCEGGVCVTNPLCADGQRCCPNAEGTSAACGECCGPEHCEDDMVDCTVKVCRSGVCGNEPDRSLCEDDQTCDPEQGCLSGVCNGEPDCAPPGICEEVECHNGVCRYSDKECSDGASCCPDGPLQNTCRQCCSNTDCQNATTEVNCCQDDGQCHECCSDADCGGVIGTFASGGAIGVPLPCVTNVCDLDSRKCTTQTLPCPNDQACCSDGFCPGSGRECVPELPF